MKYILDNIVAIICSIALLFVTINIESISLLVAETFDRNPSVVVEEPNQYKKNDNYTFVQNTTNFMPLSYGDILNIYYTITNSGYKEFTFYCPSEYKNCLTDVEEISNDPEILTYINNFVHPYNSFSNIQTIISESGEINIKVNYLYNEDEIKQVNDKVNEIYSSIITEDLSDYDKIKVIHDYIINHTKYDVIRNKTGDSEYLSYKAYGALLEGYATCSGYTDAMAIFLEKMNIKNFKIATELMQSDISGHVWNAVFIDGNWLHLDLTWDDPVSNDGTDYLQHKYFLITTKELQEIDNSGDVTVKEHIFNKKIYNEIKN